MPGRRTPATRLRASAAGGAQALWVIAGGVPQRWIIDNLKAGVDKPDPEERGLNPSFALISNEKP